MDVATGQSTRLGSEADRASGPRWSPDGKWIAFFGRSDGKVGADDGTPDGTERAASSPWYRAPTTRCRHRATRLAWSPDGRADRVRRRRRPGPRRDANGDPMVITRYLYKPTAGEGLTRFNDNRRLHIFVVDVGDAAGAAAHRRATTTSTRSTGRRRRRDPVRLEPRGRPRPDLQLRHLHGRVGDGADPAAHRHEERRVPSGVVARRQHDRLPRHEARADVVGDDDGGHARLGDRTPTAPDRREIGAALDNRQGAPRLVDRRRGTVLHRRRSAADVAVPRSPAGGAPEAGRRRGGPAGPVGAWSAGPTARWPTLRVAGRAGRAVRQAAATARPGPLTPLNAALLASRDDRAGRGACASRASTASSIEAFLTRPLDDGPRAQASAHRR